MDEITLNEHSKDQSLAPNIEYSQSQYLTTDGVYALVTQIIL